jgi:hypothetical protein
MPLGMGKIYGFIFFFLITLNHKGMNSHTNDYSNNQTQ